MSILRVNEIRSQSGNTVVVPSGYQLSLDGTIVNSTSLPPDPSGQGGKFVQSTGSGVVWTNVGPNGIRVFNSSGTWTKPLELQKF